MPQYEISKDLPVSECQILFLLLNVFLIFSHLLPLEVCKLETESCT